MRTILYVGICIGLLSCSQEAKQKKNKDTEPAVETKQENVDKSDLVEIVGDQYTEYYPGKKAIKFQGTQDPEGQRHGKWLYFSENGDELSMAMYEHGKKHGHSIVKYPNGAIHYIGEYRDNVQVGEWKTYNADGKLFEVKDFGFPAN